MKKLTVAVMIAALAWSGWWLWSAAQLRGTTEDWFEARQAAGWAASYDDLSVRGFPNRLDTTFTGLTLADPDASIVWEAPFFQLLRLSYRPGHLIAVWPSEQRLSLQSERYLTTSEGLRASVISEDGGTIARANLEAEVLNIAPDTGTSASGPALALAGLRAAFALVPDTADSYHLAVSADAAARSPGALAAVTGSSLGGLRLDAVIDFDAPFTFDTAHQPRPQPRRIALRLAEYRVDDLELRLAGNADVDSLGRLTGELTVRAVNWRALLRRAQAAGRLPSGMAGTLEQGLALIAGMNGNAETLDLPLRLKDGAMSLGPIPLGQAPRLILP